MKNTLAILATIMAGLMVQTHAEVVLSDDFTVTGGANADINAELGGGRNTGTLTTTYTLEGNAISGAAAINDFFGNGGNAHMSGTLTNGVWMSLDLDTNFGTKLAGQTWELEFTTHVVDQGNWTGGWSGFGVSSASGDIVPFGDFGVIIRPDNAVSIFTNGVYSHNVSASHNPFDHILKFKATFNETYGNVTVAYDAFDAATTNYLGTGLIGTISFNFSSGDRYVDVRVVADSVSAPDATDAYYDGIRIETTPGSAPEYLFFDSYDTADTNDINADILSRQTNSVFVAPYTLNSDHYAIESDKLKVLRGAGLFSTTANLNDIVGENFEFGFQLDLDMTDSSWTSTHILSANETGRGQSRIGLYATGSGDTTWAYLLYKGTDGAGANNVLEGISLALMVEKIPTFDKLAPHELKFISTAGTGGTNHYDFVVDGVTIISNVEYAFSEGTVRTIETINTLPADLSQNAFYDDLYIKVIKGVTYDDWADDNGLIGADRDFGADLEPDGMDNLLEYALGGDPLADDAGAILPTADFTLAGVRYIYSRRVDATLRGLTYGLIVNTDGLQLPWTPVGTAFETGTGVINPEFEAVTNDLPTSTEIGFVNLEVSGAN